MMRVTRFRRFGGSYCRDFDSFKARTPQNGASLLEFAVVLAVGATIAYALFEGVAYVQERSEKMLYEQTLAGLDAGLRYEAMSRHTRGQSKRMEELADENPFNWLQQRPGNYLGERDAVRPGTLKPGHWAYDRGQYAVVYSISRGERFQPATGSLREIRLKVNATAGDPAQVGMKAVGKYRWLE